jgi:uncharacterized protein (TIGR02118 family)
MLAIHILYPKTDDSTFDMDYYTSTHMPMLAAAFGDACKGWGATEVTAGEWEAIGWCHVESQEAFDSAMAAKGAEIMVDVPNYTNVQPQLVIGQVSR